jgi:predicted DNA-binding protein (UPF0251 family)
MARPPRCLCRGIKFKPHVVYFKPQGVPISGLQVVELSMEELEAYRLRYIGNLEQKAAASELHISQSTYQRMLYSSYKKIADALINGKAIRIIKHE